MAKDTQLRDSVQMRRAKELAKALRKYGEDGLLPGGEPSFDILDYVINEVVGLIRYGEMIEARFGSHPDMSRPAHAMAVTLRSFGCDVGGRLISMRQALLERHGTLGTTEE